MKLSAKVKEEILELQNSYPESRSALIPALHLAQAEVGYLPSEVQKEVADLFGIQVNEVNAVVSFYEMFFEEPCGKHILHVCKNVSCMLHGSDEIIERLCKKLQIRPGETTADGQFTLNVCECLAACDRAPMMLVDEKVVGPLKADDLDHYLAKVWE